MLLTDFRVTRSRKSIWRILKSYLTRWRIEETIRFLKQNYQVEDIRLLTYHRLQNMMAILTAVAYYAMVYLGLRTKLRVLARHVMGAVRRLFGIPDFHFYSLADGIREFLFGYDGCVNIHAPILPCPLVLDYKFLPEGMLNRAKKRKAGQEDGGKLKKATNQPELLCKRQ